MKLNEYLDLMDDGDELTVWDTDYDIETYFYHDDLIEDKWQNSMNELSKLLTITKISTRGVIVNLSKVIEKKIEKLKEANLFIHCDIDSIMEDIMSILSGNVSEEWMEKFVDILRE